MAPAVDLDDQALPGQGIEVVAHLLAGQPEASGHAGGRRRFRRQFGQEAGAHRFDRHAGSVGILEDGDVGHPATLSLTGNLVNARHRAPAGRAGPLPTRVPPPV
jgi:hypothetical protein